jgi:hypothetical protein
MSFPFPKLLAFLEEEKDQVEFMKVANELGLGSGDIEIAKILIALQIYKSIYAKIPREIKAVHSDALNEFRRVRDEVEFISNRASSDAVKIGEWAEVILRKLEEAEPRKLAALVHKRLLDDTVKILGGSLQTFATAQAQIDTATQKMNLAAQQAETAIDAWQTLTLRGVWACAFSCCVVAALFVVAVVWLLFGRP